jgi:hypothetical protein
MARAREQRNVRLEEAMANLLQSQTALLQNQAIFAQTQASFLARTAEIDQRISEMERTNAERFARIEAILMEHSRILRALPDAIREKIGSRRPNNTLPLNEQAKVRGLRVTNYGSS